MKKEEIISVLSDWNFWGKGLDTGRERAFYLNKILSLLEGVEKGNFSLRGKEKREELFVKTGRQRAF